jgi:hypothetical protein
MHKKAFLTNFVVGAKEEDWTGAKKANKALMEAAWSHIAMVVQGHALKSVIKVTSENPKEAWDDLKAEFEPNEITDVVSLNNDFTKMTLKMLTKYPKNWIERLEYKELARSNQNILTW